MSDLTLPSAGSLKGLSLSSAGSDGFDDSPAFAPFPFWGSRSRICIWLATTSIVVRFSPSGPAHFLVCKRPSRYTCLPLLRNSPQTSASRPKQTILNHSTLSREAPSPSFHLSLTARLKVPTGLPFWPNLSSGASPRNPIRVTLFTHWHMSCVLLPPHRSGICGLHDHQPARPSGWRVQPSP